MQVTGSPPPSFTQLLRNTGLESALAAGLEPNGCIAFVDYCRVEDKYHFVNELLSGFRPRKLLLIDAVPRDRQGRVPGVYHVSAPPDLTYSESFPRLSLTRIDLSSLLPDLLSEEQNFIRHFRHIDPPADAFAIRRCLTSAFAFSYACLALARPKAVLIWNAFHPLSMAARKAADALGVKCYFMEYGLLPGTMNFDAHGQMGESRVSVESPAFAALPIEEKDRINARAALDHFVTSRRSRHPSTKDEQFSERIRSIANGRPLVLFAGHNDLASGTFPYTPEVARHHSPIFKSSAEAALEVFRIAAAQGVAVLYKPHPLYDGLNTQDLPDHVIAVRGANIIDCIDASDVMVTVLSQSAYMARMRDKPVVLLGRLHMSRTGSVHECESLSDIPEKIRLAMTHGYTDAQDQAWLDHVARLLRYYLYRWDADLPDRLICNDLPGACKAILTGADGVDHFGLA